jgi:hypothetical protein
VQPQGQETAGTQTGGGGGVGLAPTALFQSPTSQSPSKGAVITAIEELVKKQTPEEIRTDFTWQQGRGAEKETREAFKEEALAFHPTVKLFAFVSKNSAIVKTVHGLTKYFGTHAPEYRGKILGRMGEWTPFNSPSVLVMPDTTWKWEDVQLNRDTAAWEAAVGETKGEVWTTAPSAPATTIKLPRLLYLPPVVAKFVLQQERSALEVYRFVEELAAVEESAVGAEEAEMIKNWFLAAGQKGVSTGGQKIVVAVEPTLNVAQGFVQWTNVQLASYLRQPHVVQQQSTNGAQAQAATATGAYLQSVTQVLNSMAAKTAAASDETARKTEEGRVLNEWDMAALCGYCCVDNPELCPPIYKTLRHTKNVEDARQVITKAMEDWAERRPRRIEIDRGVFLSEEVIKNIMKVTPNPGGVVATAEPSDKIVSNLVCLPRRMADIERLRRLERLREETEGNRSFREAEKLAKSDVRAPPRTYYSLKLNIATTMALVAVCYGKFSRMLFSLEELYEILDGREAYMLRDEYTPNMCKAITWAVYDDMRSYFATRLMPEDFLKQNVRYPTSLLADIHADVRFVREVFRVTFPPAWKEKPFYEDVNGRIQQVDPRRTASIDVDDTERYTHANRRRQTNQQPNQNNQGGSLCPEIGSNLNHLHPKISIALKDYHDKYCGKVVITQIMELAKVTWQMMPRYQPMENKLTRKDEMCWNHVFGQCPYGDRCLFKKNHVTGSSLPDEWVLRALNILKPGFMAMLKAGIPVGPASRKFNGGASVKQEQD